MDPREFGWGRAAEAVARVGVSLDGDKSESCRSGGGGVVRRFSLEIVEGVETCGKTDEGAVDAGSETIVDVRDRCKAASWSFKTDTSTLVSDTTR